MKRKYESPEVEMIKFTLSADVLTISQGEHSTSSGYIIPPDEEMVEMEEP